MKTNTLLATAITALGLAAVSAPSFALPVTFAQFQQSSNAKFTFTNNSTSPTNLELTATLPVTFDFLVPNLTGLVVPPSTNGIAATLVLTAIAEPAVTVGNNVIEEFSSVSMTFTDDEAGADFGKNLFTVVNTTTGTLTSKTNANSASLNGDSGAGDTVTYTSDFLFFSNTVTRDYDLSFSALNPKMIIATSTASHRTKGFPETFTANGTGTFASDPAPTEFNAPEPSPAIALLIGGAGLALLFVRNRKIASARPISA
jgi:hypothetical protein